MRYTMRCQVCGEVEVTRSIHQGVSEIEPCPHDGYAARRIWGAPQFQEDRLRLRKTYGTPTDNWSYALHGPMPETRSDLKRAERERGIEFTSELTPNEKRIMEYRHHVDTGGERLTSEQVNPTKVESKPLTYYMDKRKFRVDQ